jgi:glycosyltransferase involved in cell wall biosynthesis
MKTVDFIWACSDSFYGIIACLLGRKYGVPVVFDLYDNFEFFLAAKLPVIKQLYRWSLGKCDAVTCVSQPLGRLVGTFRHREGITVLENSVRRDLFRPMSKDQCRIRFGLPQEGVLIGTAGALHENRGIHHLFEAFFQLKRKYPSLGLLLAGPRRRGFQIPKHSDIHDVGVLAFEEVPAFLNALDVAVICNLENEFGKYCFPQKAREIMACDVPVVAAGVGAMKELLHTNTEWLYSPDDAADLARVVEHRLTDRRTGYNNVISWEDAASCLEAVLGSISNKA